jgi:predicted ATPase
VLSQHSRELLDLSAEHGFEFMRALAVLQHGWCLTALGHPEEGISQSNAGLTDIRATGNFLGTPGLLTRLADAYRMTGQPQVGLEHLVEAERLAETTQEKWVHAETLRLKGDLLLLVGDPIAAERSFRDAIALAQRQAAKLFELRSTTSLARLWRDQGKIADAQALLAPIYNWFTEGFDAPDLLDAKALLDELELRVEPP